MVRVGQDEWLSTLEKKKKKKENRGLVADSVLTEKDIKDAFKISRIFMEKEKEGNEVSRRKVISLFEEFEVNSFETAQWTFEMDNLRDRSNWKCTLTEYHNIHVT